MSIRFALIMPLLLAVPAHAGTITHVAVPYADLNLVSAHGQATLDRRVDAAVKNVCEDGRSRELAMRAASQKCQKAARDVARATMQVAVDQAVSSNQLAAAGAAPKS